MEGLGLAVQLLRRCLCIGPIDVQLVEVSANRVRLRREVFYAWEGIHANNVAMDIANNEFDTVDIRDITQLYLLF